MVLTVPPLAQVRLNLNFIHCHSLNCNLVQAMPGFLGVFGYPDPTSVFGYGIDSTVQQLINSLVTLGSFVTSCVAGLFGLYLGRRLAIVCACVLNIIACIIMLTTDTICESGIAYCLILRSFIYRTFDTWVCKRVLCHILEHLYDGSSTGSSPWCCCWPIRVVGQRWKSNRDYRCVANIVDLE